MTWRKNPEKWKIFNASALKARRVHFKKNCTFAFLNGKDV